MTTEMKQVENALIDSMRASANVDIAVDMKAYQKNQFEFLGIQTPARRKLSRAFIKIAKHQPVDWDFVARLWALPEREFQYVACDYLKQMQDLLVPEDLARIEKLVTTKSWWDTVDSLDRTVGQITRNYPEYKQVMLEWSQADNFWLRRIAIDHQLTCKEQTDVSLLERILINNLNQTEFFINKAMGWALRDYSKTNPDWVRQFIDSHRSGLSKLTIREGSKYL
jgi:3-methyladenine DNA glycosylase AlkD